MTERLIITIDLGNSAFADDQGGEVARILRDLAHNCQETGFANNETIYDANGNRVGQMVVSYESADAQESVADCGNCRSFTLCTKSRREDVDGLFCSDYRPER